MLLFAFLNKFFKFKFSLDNQFPRAGKDLTFKGTVKAGNFKKRVLRNLFIYTDREYCENQKESDFHNLLGPLFVHTKKKVKSQLIVVIICGKTFNV